MKTLIYLPISLLMFGCTNTDEKPLKKPFVIVYKFPKGVSCNFDSCAYKYVDANGREIKFCESELKYDIGDTIY